MDDIARYNRDRWAALAEARAVFTRPLTNLTAASAREFVDPDGMFGNLAGKRVLCLAGGGGQQSVAFALLGADVVVVDLSAEQLQRDREAAAHYGLNLDVAQGDMRDLGHLDASSFDLVYHPYSLNFVPESPVVFREVARIMQVNGLYYFMCANPFVHGVQAQDWNGQGYTLKLPYVDGAEIRPEDERWMFRGDTASIPVPGPREFRHTLGTLINGLVGNGFAIVRVEEDRFGEPDPTAAPGTPKHLSVIAPPWLKFWASYRPDVLKQ